MFQSPRAASWLPLISNGGLVALKLGVGIAMGSISVVSDGLDSAMDTLSALIMLVSIRIASRPPDEGHPYGHGKAENLSGAVESLFIFAGGVFITVQAFQRISQGVELRLVDLGIGTMAASMVVNMLVSWHLLRVARRSGSPALAAAGKHRATDILTSGSVLLGLVVVRLTGVTILDPLLALVVAAVIFWAAGQVAHSSFRALMDVRLPKEEEQRVYEVAARYRHWALLKHLHTRKAGPHRHFDITMTTCQHLSVGEAHHLCDRMEEEVRRMFSGSKVAIHVEPCTQEEGAPCPDSCPVNGTRAARPQAG